MAQDYLGVFYATGQGVTKNYAEAAKWFRKAAEQNFAKAQSHLGLSYAEREGVPKDYVEGYRWVLLAAGQRDEGAKEYVTTLENAMSREQIAE